jgi:hypothetical protein
MTPLQIANQHEEYAARNIQEPSVTVTTPFDPQTTAAGVLAWADLGGLNRCRADAETRSIWLTVQATETMLNISDIP